MNLKTVSLLGFVLFNLVSIKLVSSKASDILVRVFYETQSSSSMDFMAHQMLPLYRKLGDYFLIRFVPFGNSKMKYDDDSGLWYFTCPHGNDECYYNMIHACALSKIQNRDTRAGFLACLMTTKNENSVLEKCSDMFNVNLDDIKYCVHKCKDGNQLLAGYGNETNHFFPNGLSIIPSVTINGVYKKKDAKLALCNLEELVCKYINFYEHSPPEDCKKYFV